MLGKERKRGSGRRIAVLAGAGAALMLGIGLAGTAGASAAARPLANSAASVPWKSVGAGWVLADDQASPTQPVTLDLLSPSGAKYMLHTWPASQDAIGQSLIAWSPAKTGALFEGPVYNQLEQLNLQTGKITVTAFPKDTVILGYTLPAGKQLLGYHYSGTTETMATYSLAGKLVRNLASQRETIGAVQAKNGSTFAVSGTTGLRLVSGGGKLLKNLTVAGTDSTFGCTPVRWWTSAEVLANCTIKSGKSFHTHLYLVPVSGAKPKQLTPARTSGSDLGDLDAWQLKSGLYLQSSGACGQLEINKQAANGSIIPVTVPGTKGGSYAVLSASGSALLVDTLGCTRGGQLLWYNPATKAEKWLLKSGAGGVVPFYSTLNGGRY